MRTLMLLLIALLAPIAHAQSSGLSSHPSSLIAPSTNAKSASPLPAPTPPADDPVGLAIERAINRATLAEELNREKDKQIDVLRGRLSDKDEIIAILKTQKGDLQGANADRREARTIDLERIADRDTIIAKQQAEIQRLRHPGFFASLFDKRTVYGAVGGYAFCKVTSSSGGIQSLNPFQSSQIKWTPAPAGVDFSLMQTSADERVRQILKAHGLQSKE